MPPLTRTLAAVVLAITLVLSSVPSLNAADVPAPYDVTFWVQTTPDAAPEAMVVEVHPEWAPIGEARFRELAEEKFYDDCKFFRSIKRFVAQFGLAADPSMTKQWSKQKIKDDPVLHSNLAGTLTFATSGPNSRTTQLFFNFANNKNLDKMGFAPFAVVKKAGLPLLLKINTEYGEKPSQGSITKEGNVYLDNKFPNLSIISSIDIGGAVPMVKEPEEILPHQMRGNHLEGKHAALDKRERLYADKAHHTPDDDDHHTGFLCDGDSPHCAVFVFAAGAMLLLCLKQRNGYHIVRDHNN